MIAELVSRVFFESARIALTASWYETAVSGHAYNYLNVMPHG